MKNFLNTANSAVKFIIGVGVLLICGAISANSFTIRASEKIHVTQPCNFSQTLATMNSSAQRSHRALGNRPANHAVDLQLNEDCGGDTRALASISGKLTISTYNTNTSSCIVSRDRYDGVIESTYTEIKITNSNLQVSYIHIDASATVTDRNGNSISAWDLNGKDVKTGDIIGKIASIGCSSGAHIHYEVRTSNGSYMNNSEWEFTNNHARRDVNYDGKSDVLYNGLCGSNAENCWRTHLSSGTSFSNWRDSGASIGISGNNSYNQPLTGDFDEDGYQDDIAYYGICGADSHGCWRVHLSDGNIFNNWRDYGASTWFATSGPLSTPVVGDFDNDYFVDDIAYYGKCGSNGSFCWRIHFSNGTTFNTWGDYGASMWFNNSSYQSTPVAGDFDNDSFIDDIAYYGKCGSSGASCWRIHFSNGTTFNTWGDYGASMWFNGSSSAYNKPVVGDFDGDSFRDDIAYYGKCGSSGASCWRVHLSNGTTFNTWGDYGASMWFNSNGQISSVLVGDYNGDGKDDLTYYGKCGSNGDTCWRTHINAGNYVFNWGYFGNSTWLSSNSMVVL